MIGVCRIILTLRFLILYFKCRFLILYFKCRRSFRYFRYCIRPNKLAVPIVLGNSGLILLIKLCRPILFYLCLYRPCEDRLSELLTFQIYKLNSLI